ncbi:ATP-binding protein [Undibacterium sp. Di26W]|uniref:ATP-binding protein n=1 Tax=Undibacterium sp. Di26W TaxID=3413035 RepID=UPI003BF01BBD
MGKNNMAESIESHEPSRIQITSVKFSEIPFRRLGNIIINIAPRFTLIAGRNGVGKSTLLGLIANASGITRGKNLTYFGRLPQGNIHEIIQLSMDKDFVESETEKPNVYLSYNVNSKEILKKCNITLRKGFGLRVVPRNEPKEPVSVGNITIKADGKIPLPTIYLGMIRMMPIGEVEPGTLESNSYTIASHSDAVFIEEFTNRIISTGVSSALKQQPNITYQAVKDTKKRSLHPPYKGYDSKAVSLGQDSLSSIATALASFQKIKETMGTEYPGGLLVIDEIDAGFHPQAQKKLFQELKSEARRLRLQIIATTHSLTMLSEAHQEIAKIPANNVQQDSIVYLQGGNPVQLMDASNFEAIHDDMFLNLKNKRIQNTIKVYVEDAEAALFLKRIISRKHSKLIEEETGKKIEVLTCHLGCTNLMALHKADNYFKTVIVIVDGDTSARGIPKVKNIIRLPTDSRIHVKQAPEPIIEAMSKLLVDSDDEYPETRKLLKKAGYSTDYIQSHILDLQGDESTPSKSVADDREHAKNWFNRRLTQIQELKLIEGWVVDNEEAVNVFIAKVIEAVEFVKNETNLQS